MPFFATGVYKAREIQAPGAGLANIVPAMTYLTAANRKGLGDAVPDYDDGTLDAAGKHVVVIGGGDTAMDCVRTAVRQGAASVKCLYRRDRPQHAGLTARGSSRGGGRRRIHLAVAPEAFIGRAAAPKGRRKGAVREAVGSVRALRMRLGIADATGRQVPEPIADSDFDLPADIVVKALGFDPDDLPTQFAAPTLATTKWGTLAIDRRSFMTSIDGVFAAGDIVRGASLVVWAIRDGRDAAAQIHRYIQAKAGAAVAEAAE